MIAVARTSKIMLNKSGENGIPCLVPDLTGKAFIFSPLNMMLAVGLLYMLFYMCVCHICQDIFTLPTFCRVFFLIINGC